MKLAGLYHLYMVEQGYVDNILPVMIKGEASLSAPLIRKDSFLGADSVNSLGVARYAI